MIYQLHDMISMSQICSENWMSACHQTPKTTGSENTDRELFRMPKNIVQLFFITENELFKVGEILMNRMSRFNETPYVLAEHRELVYRRIQNLVLYTYSKMQIVQKKGPDREN